MSIVRVALVQARPEILNLKESFEKAVSLIEEAAAQGAELVAFAEGWLSGYPAWIDHCPDIARWDDPPTRKVYRRFWENSLDISGSEAQQLSFLANKHKLGIIIAS